MSNTNCTSCESSDGCRGCYECRGCYGCRGCYECYGCYGCGGCRGCYGCDGCYYSFGLKDCRATYKSIFSVGLFGDNLKVFGKESTESRYQEIFNKINSFGFYQKQTNAFELYTQNGSEWSKIPASKLSYKEWDDSWKDCPKELIAYLSSLPEFDAALFKEITELDATGNNEAKKKDQELEAEAEKLLSKAKELRESL